MAQRAGNEKTLAMSILAGVWAQRDPLAAGTFVAELPPGETQNEAVKSVISSWAAQNPAQTATGASIFRCSSSRAMYSSSNERVG